jgi:hypothetical protein
MQPFRSYSRFSIASFLIFQSFPSSQISRLRKASFLADLSLLLLPLFKRSRVLTGVVLRITDLSLTLTTFLKLLSTYFLHVLSLTSYSLLILTLCNPLAVTGGDPVGVPGSGPPPLFVSVGVQLHVDPPLFSVFSFFSLLTKYQVYQTCIF